MNNDQQRELETIRTFYEEDYYRDLPARVAPSGHHRRLVRRLRVAAPLAVLDVACGTGGWLMACAEAGATVAGVDLSQRAIACCTRDLPTGEFHATPAERLPYADRRFDLVTCLGSLEHFVDPLAALREMRRVARPAARYVILVPNADFLTRRLGLYGGTRQTRAREDVRSLAEWQALFATAGLEVQARWKDLHVLSPEWILRRPLVGVPARLLQALALPLWPLAWQYQVFFLCAAAPQT